VTRLGRSSEEATALGALEGRSSEATALGALEGRSTEATALGALVVSESEVAEASSSKSTALAVDRVTRLGRSSEGSHVCIVE